MEDANEISTPIELGAKLPGKVEESAVGEHSRPYRELVGALGYLASATRLDIAFSVSYLSQFNSFHQEEHWKAAKRVFRYLKLTLKLGITYSGIPAG